MESNEIITNAELIMAINNERVEMLKQFNPFNEPILIMHVVECKVFKRLRPWIGFKKKNKEEGRKRGFPIFEQVPPSQQEYPITEQTLKVRGISDVVNFIDPDVIDPMSNLPITKTYKAGDIFLATKNPAIIMEWREVAFPVPEFKNEPDKDGKVRFDWAEPDEILSDVNGFLIEKYTDRYAVENRTVEGLATQMLAMRNESDLLKKKIAELEERLNGK